MLTTTVSGCGRLTGRDAAGADIAASSVSKTSDPATTSDGPSTTSLITKPDPKDTGSQTVSEWVSCPAPGSLRLLDVVRNAGDLGGSMFLGVLAMGTQVRQNTNGMLFTDATVTVTRQIGGVQEPQTLTAYVPGGRVDGLVGVQDAGVATGPDGQFFAVLVPHPGGLDGDRITGLPVVDGQLYFTPTTCLQADGLPGVTNRQVSYTLIDKGVPAQVSGTVPMVDLAAALKALGL